MEYAILTWVWHEGHRLQRTSRDTFLKQVLCETFISLLLPLVSRSRSTGYVESPSLKEWFCSDTEMSADLGWFINLSHLVSILRHSPLVYSIQSHGSRDWLPLQCISFPQKIISHKLLGCSSNVHHPGCPPLLRNACTIRRNSVLGS